MFSFTRSQSRSRPKTGRLRNPGLWGGYILWVACLWGGCIPEWLCLWAGCIVYTLSGLALGWLYTLRGLVSWLVVYPEWLSLGWLYTLNCLVSGLVVYPWVSCLWACCIPSDLSLGWLLTCLSAGWISTGLFNFLWFGSQVIFDSLDIHGFKLYLHLLYIIF